MSNKNNETACGNCDAGTYALEAMLNRKAREFSVLSESERALNIPKCKTRDCNCVGFTHFHEMITSIDERVSNELD